MGVRGAVLLAAVALLIPGAPVASPAVAAPAVAQPSVQLQVTDVTPSAPKATTKPAPLSIRIKITNRSAVPLPKVEIRADRGEPIGTPASLDSSLATRTPAATGLPVQPTRPVTAAVPANDSTSTTFATTASLLNNGKGLCLCHNQVYPLVLSAHAAGAGGADELLGAVTTYLSSNFKPVAHPVRVSWVWPLIDRPHRLVDDAVFNDDDLAGSVAGGRLDHALQVVEQVAKDQSPIPVTLVVDPELLDELEVMAAGKYTVQVPGSPLTRPGTGRDAALNWLARFAALLDSRPSIDVSLTPYADPDVSTLNDSGLSWSTLLPAPMAQRVALALSGRAVQSQVAWPPSGAVDQHTLTTLAQAGAHTVLLGSAAVSSSSVAGVPASLTRLTAGNTTVTAALTSPTVQDRITRAVLTDGSAELPALTAEITVRAVADPAIAQTAVLAPNRYVDPDVTAAVRAIRATSSSPFAVPASLSALTALSALPPAPTGKLRAVSSKRPKLPSDLTSTVERVDDDLPMLHDLFADGAAARPLLAALPVALQRLSSAAWRAGGGPFRPALGVLYADRLDALTQALLHGVNIVKPSSGSYTLASSTAKLPITVENNLDYPVYITVAVTTQNGVPGYTASPTRGKRIAPHSKLIVQVASRVERSGRIPVQAQLETASGAGLGPPVRLFVHSTVFGLIGILITVLAGGVLVLALIVRFGRRLHSRRSKAAEPASTAVPSTTDGTAPSTTDGTVPRGAAS